MSIRRFMLLFLLAPVALAQDGDAALARLLEGNARYVESRAARPDQTPERRAEVATVQHPFALVLGCADSRVPPEIVFDQGLGDLFVIRVAGNVLDDQVLASIEYGVEHLHIPLVIVLGHERCGAVVATIDASVRANVQHVVHDILEEDVVEKLAEEHGLRVVGGRYDLDTGKVEILE